MNKKLILSILVSSMAFGLSADTAVVGTEVAKKAGFIARNLVVPGFVKTGASKAVSASAWTADKTVGFAGDKAIATGSYLSGKTVDLGKASFAASKTAGTWSLDTLKSVASKAIAKTTPVVTSRYFVGGIVCAGLVYAAYKAAKNSTIVTAKLSRVAKALKA